MISSFTVEFNHNTYQLPICPVSSHTGIALFDLIHDPLMMRDAAVEANRYMNKIIGNDIDVIVTPECKCITLATTLALMNGCQVVMLRKSLKAYEKEQAYWSVKCHSITSGSASTLFLTQEKADLMKGKRVLVVDDVASTGDTFIAIHELLHKGGITADYFAIFNEDSPKESQFALLPSYYFLKSLPIFELAD